MDITEFKEEVEEVEETEEVKEVENRHYQMEMYNNYEVNNDKEIEDPSVKLSKVTDDLLCVTYNNSVIDLLTVVNEDTSYQDVVVYCKDGKTTTHAFILGLSSSYLKTCLLNQDKDDCEHVLYLPDFDCEIFKLFIQFIVTGIAIVTKEKSEMLNILINELLQTKGVYVNNIETCQKENKQVKNEPYYDDGNDLNDSVNAGLGIEDHSLSDNHVDSGDDSDFNISTKLKSKKRKASVGRKRGPYKKKPKVAPKSENSVPKRKYRKHNKDDPTECHICGQHYTNPRALRDHLERPHEGQEGKKKFIYLRGKAIPLEELEKTLPYQCVKCLKRFETEISLENHQSYICSICNRCCGWKANFDKHMVKHGSKEPYKCIQCDKGFATTALVQVHELEVHGNTFKCVLCNNKTFDSRSKLRSHQKRVHELRHTCNVCSRMFRTPVNLKRHHEEDHGNAPQIPCPLCPEKFFKSQRRLERHNIITHGDKHLLCSHCGQGFCFQSSLDDHIQRSHTGDLRPFVCEVCNGTFKTEKALKKHKVMMHTEDTPYQCSLCGKQFKANGNLQAHLISHSDAKPFRCSFNCNMSFKRKSTLRDHEKLVHTGTVKYSCSTCDKGFIKKDKLRVHERTHTGEKPFVCEICGSRFTTNSHRRDHQRRRHSINTKQNAEKKKGLQVNKNFLASVPNSFHQNIHNVDHSL